MALTKPQGDMLLKLGAEQATTSGTTFSFTGIPAGTTVIVVQFEGVSTDGTSPIVVQLGDSGGAEGSGYFAMQGGVTDAAAAFGAGSTAAFTLATAQSAARAVHGSMLLTLKDASNNTWVAHGVVAVDDTNDNAHALAGSKSLSGVLDRLVITTTGGDTFDAGSINIAYF